LGRGLYDNRAGYPITDPLPIGIGRGNDDTHPKHHVDDIKKMAGDGKADTRLIKILSSYLDPHYPFTDRFPIYPLLNWDE